MPYPVANTLVMSHQTKGYAASRVGPWTIIRYSTIDQYGGSGQKFLAPSPVVVACAREFTRSSSKWASTPGVAGGMTTDKPSLRVAKNTRAEDHHTSVSQLCATEKVRRQRSKVPAPCATNAPPISHKPAFLAFWIKGSRRAFLITSRILADVRLVGDLVEVHL